MLRSSLTSPRRSPVLTLLLTVLAGSFVFANVQVIARHCWRDDARDHLLSTRVDLLMLGHALVGTNDVPCIVRKDNRYDCMPRTELIETDLAAYAGWTNLNNSPAYLSAINNVGDVGFFVYADPSSDPTRWSPCADTSTVTDQRFVAQVVDKAHHRTVYVPCEGMVYVVPDEPVRSP